MSKFYGYKYNPCNIYSWSSWTCVTSVLSKRVSTKYESYICYIYQRCTNFLGQGPLCIILSVPEGWRQNYELEFRESSIKNRFSLNLISLFIACSLIFLPSVLCQIVISCKIVNSSMKFKFVHKISIIQKKLLVFLNFFEGRIKHIWGPARGPRIVHPWYICCIDFVDKSTWWTHPRHTRKCMDAVYPRPLPTTPLAVIRCDCLTVKGFTCKMLYRRHVTMY